MKTRDSLKYFMNDCRRTASDKILCNKAFNIRKIGNIMDIKRVLLKWFISFLIKNGNLSYVKLICQELADEIQKPIHRKLKKEKCTRLL